jgi:hypothetical protein
MDHVSVSIITQASKSASNDGQTLGRERAKLLALTIRKPIVDRRDRSASGGGDEGKGLPRRRRSAAAIDGNGSA